MKARLKPQQIIALSFISASLIGAILLYLPASHHGGLSPVDALFTAVSAVCVTGLIVKDTSAFWTPLGQYVILALIQLGGLGIMTFSTAFGIMLGRRLTIRHNIVLQNALDHSKVEGLKDLIKLIILLTLTIEAAGAVFLYFHWQRLLSQGQARLLFSSVFHSVSAFCNAGFSLYSNSLQGFRSDAGTNLIFTALIIAGGLGFVALLDAPKLKFWRKDRLRYYSKISLQTKLAVCMSLFLIALAFLFFSALEWDNTLKGLPLKEKLLCAYFHSVTPRTAGFNTLPVKDFRSATLFFNTGLMFIGASPGSTGGGIKTVTFAVLIAAAVSMLKHRDRISAFKRSLPKEIFRKSFIILMLGIMWIFFATLLLCMAEYTRLPSDKFLAKNFFEVVSAFGTVGLSAGITAELSAIGKALIIVTMWIGRIGPMTLALIVTGSEKGGVFTYPEERVMVG